jgi:flagellar biosynthesis protein FlhG
MVAEEIKARRIAVISGKGGVGKTFITANLAAALSSLSRRILVVDADLGLANLDILLGVDPRFTIQDVFQGRCSLDEVLLRTAKGFDLLPAGSGLPEGTALTQATVENITSILNVLELRYDAILFDAGAGVGDVVLFFANLAHEILLVATPEPTSLMDAYATIKILSLNYQRNEFLLIVNQANPEHSGQVGTAVAGHLQNIISRFLAPVQQVPVRVELVGSFPQDPAIPLSIQQRQLLAEISPQGSSMQRLNSLAGILDTRLQSASAPGSFDN